MSEKSEFWVLFHFSSCYSFQYTYFDHCHSVRIPLNFWITEISENRLSRHAWKNPASIKEKTVKQGLSPFYGSVPLDKNKFIPVSIDDIQSIYTIFFTKCFRLADHFPLQIGSHIIVLSLQCLLQFGTDAFFMPAILDKLNTLVLMLSQRSSSSSSSWISFL